jgi:glycine dehydrogenase subunit 1
MSHPWIPNSTGELRRKMLSELGINSVEELYRDIPEEYRMSSEEWDRLRIGLGRILSEYEAWRYIDEKLSRNKPLKTIPFLGAGVYPHYVPALVKHIVSRGEFLTSYTPYQPEISYGLMQALFEYQSLMAELLEMDIVNSSMYDWGSAAAEAFLMALRVKRGRRKIIIPRTMNPFHRRVAEAYLAPHDARLVEAPHDSRGTVDLEALKRIVDDDTAAVYLQNPNFLGIIEEDAKDIGEIAHERGALFIMGVYPVSLGLLEAPGRLGADIAVGEGQPLGLYPSFGGPLLGVFATRNDPKLLRQMPGRIIGITSTKDGKHRAFAMILQTREQHIRRERATSNICTNEALSAVAVAVYLSLLGPEGIRELAEVNYYHAHYAARKLGELPGVNTRLFEGEFFNEFPIGFNDTDLEYYTIHKRMLERGVHGGLYLGHYYPELGEAALYAFTEMHTKNDIDLLVNVLGESLREG